MVLVVPEEDGGQAQGAFTQLLRIGYEQVDGYLDGGVRAWQSTGRTARSYPVADVDDLRRADTTNAPPLVLDVRQPEEWAHGVIPGSLRLFVGDLPGRVDDLPRDKEVWTICRSGHRAAIAASLLDRAGRQVRLVARGGVEGWFTLSPATDELPSSERLTLPLTVRGDLGIRSSAQR
jgi:hydroxyacylglutathione hydrolase